MGQGHRAADSGEDPMVTILAFLFVLGALILVHELGHFILAKAFGIKVLTFSFGFGPKVLKFRRGETEYALSLLPLGGYVKMLGEDPEEDISLEDQKKAFNLRPLWQRALIVLAGPGANLLFSAFLFSLVFLTGTPRLLPVVGSAVEGYPAMEAGLKEGDRILAIDGQEVRFWDDLLRIIPESKGRPLQLLVEREGKQFLLTLVPKEVKVKDIFGEEVKHYQIGITPRGDVVEVRYGPLESLGLGFKQTRAVAELVLLSLWKILKGVLSAKTIGGPLMIAQMAGQEARQGLGRLLSFTAIIGVNLGLLNLFPIPILDGGHLLLYGLQAVLRRPLDPHKLEVIQKIGLMLLVALMLLAFYNDISRIWGTGR